MGTSNSFAEGDICRTTLYGPNDYNVFSAGVSVSKRDARPTNPEIFPVYFIPVFVNNLHSPPFSLYFSAFLPVNAYQLVPSRTMVHLHQSVVDPNFPPRLPKLSFVD